MEYEIEDDALLFDDSTNPSLSHEHREPTGSPAPARTRNKAVQKRRLQKAEVIPDEEESGAPA